MVKRVRKSRVQDEMFQVRLKLVKATKLILALRSVLKTEKKTREMKLVMEWESEWMKGKLAVQK